MSCFCKKRTQIRTQILIRLSPLTRSAFAASIFTFFSASFFGFLLFRGVFVVHLTFSVYRSKNLAQVCGSLELFNMFYAFEMILLSLL